MALFQQSMLGFPCSAQAIPFPNLFGAEFLRLEASLVSNYSQFVYEGYYLNHNSLNVTDVSFCNVSLAYTHPGQSDTINVQVWLPTVAWNGRMQGIGGSGWSAGMTPFSFTAMAGAVGEGYVGVTTDGGHNSDADPSDWALLSPGNVNLYALQDFGSVSLNDAAVIGKELAKSFYGRPPRYSYFSGCSQGGRQGYMLAQRYPTAYDGIAASAPAIYLSQFVFGAFWPQLFMALLGEYPHPCEFDAITAAAVAACDSSDGAVDGIVSDPDSCQFDPYSLVGTTINCSDTGRDQQISVAAAKVVNATWAGAVSSTGSFLWHGLNRDAVLTGPLGTASTECDVNGTCAGKPASLITDWIRLFVQKDPAFSVSNMTHTEFDRLFHASVQQFTSIIGTNDANLAEFRDAGGKMLTYHGLVSPASASIGNK